VGNPTTIQASGRQAAPAGEPGLHELPHPLTFEAIYHAHFGRAVGWMRAMRVPAADLEDAAQEVFLVARRKFPSFRGDNVSAWLYRIADLTARNYRRLAWFKRFFGCDADDAFGDALIASNTPAVSFEQKEEQRALSRMLARMSDKRRETFVLFEIEGYSGQEIAALQGVPVATVWTRLHHARKDLLAMVAAWRLRGEREVGRS